MQEPIKPISPTTRNRRFTHSGTFSDGYLTAIANMAYCSLDWPRSRRCSGIHPRISGTSRPKHRHSYKSAFHVQTYNDLDKLNNAAELFRSDHARVARLGASCIDDDLSDSHVVAQARLMRQFDYHRAFKTPFELQCMRNATANAVLGHRGRRSSVCRRRERI